MLTILYEDKDIIVVKKPIGMESQSSRGFAPDMVSEIKKHINTLSTTKGEPYVGVIHRLDKPVGGIMVYAKTPKAAAVLSQRVKEGSVDKRYLAVVCGEPVDKSGKFVDYLLMDKQKNYTQVVEKGINAKRAELDYSVLKTAEYEGETVSLVEIELITGRHHQIRVQFASRGLPLWGDNRYNPKFTNTKEKSGNLALYAFELSFLHPVSNKKMQFHIEPEGKIFEKM